MKKTNEVLGTPAACKQSGVAAYRFVDIYHGCIGEELLARTITNAPLNERAIRGF